MMHTNSFGEAAFGLEQEAGEILGVVCGMLAHSPLDLEWLVSSQEVIKHDLFATQANIIGDIYTHTSTNGNRQYIPIHMSA